MRSFAASTCQRCLGVLKSSPCTRPSFTNRTKLSQASHHPRAFSTRDSNGPITGRTPGNNLAGGRNTEKRSVSTNIPHGQTVTEEPPELRTPGGLASTPAPIPSGRPLLLPNNLFHSFSRSPSPEIRQRAAFMKQNAYCSHPDHRQTRIPLNPDDPEARKETGTLPPAHVDFECPDCGIPVSCTEEHWADDYEAHLEICDTLREINEDDHDLRSGRFFPEFEYPGDQLEEFMVNMTNWDTLLYTREFRAINDERSLRQATRLLTYPVTISSVLHELSPYDVKRGGRLTVEGLKSLSGRLNILISVISSRLICLQHSAILYILQETGRELASKAYAQIRHRCESSFLVHELNHLYREKFGLN